MVAATVGRCEFCGNVHVISDARSSEDCTVFGFGSVLQELTPCPFCHKVHTMSTPPSALDCVPRDFEPV